MNSFLKILENSKIKHTNKKKSCSNPPKKNIIKPKPLLAPILKKKLKRNFGKDIQNIRVLTEENHLLFNKKKRNRKKKDKLLNFNKNENSKDKIIVSKINHNNKKQKNKIFNVIHLSHNKLNQNNKNSIICIEEEEIENKIDKENINPNLSKQIINIRDYNDINKNKESQILINKNNSCININYREIKVIKKNGIKIDDNKNNEKKNEEEEENKDMKIIKVSILSNNKYNSPRTPRKCIDINKRFELQSAKEYLDEIYLHLKSIEKKNLPLENYMSIKQTDINEKMRIILINWIIEVHFKFHLLSETLYICINIIDRYLSQKNINRKYLQLLGVTALFIACKYEEIYAPTSKDLIFMTDNAYKKEEMIQMESDILNIIHFDLTFPSSLRFLEIYKHFLNLDEINYYRCCYLNEISLINYNLCSFNPSLIACVCLYLNLKTNILYFKGYNEEQLFNITGYKKIDIKICLNKLISAVLKIEDPDNKFIAVKKKYALEKYMKVSNDCYLIKEENEDISKSKGSFSLNVNLLDNMVIE